MRMPKTDAWFFQTCFAVLIGSRAFALPTCTDLGSNPAYGLAGNPAITKLEVSVVPVGSSVFDPRFYVPPGGGSRTARPPLAATIPYCQIDFAFNSGESGPQYGYNAGQSEAIGIRVGLPLRADDGGGAQGWNGKIHNIGQRRLYGVSAAGDGGNEHWLCRSVERRRAHR